jgi:hypothetical protein
MLKENEQLTKPQASSRLGQTNGAGTKTFVEKKGFKRAEAAIYLGISTITIDRLTKRGLLHPSRALRHPIYSKDDLDRFFKDTTADAIQVA